MGNPPVKLLDSPLDVVGGHNPVCLIYVFTFHLNIIEKSRDLHS
jgi:hypothetical protein